MGTTNDDMYTKLVVRYPTAGKTLGDLLYAFWSEIGLEKRGTLSEGAYRLEGAVGDTFGDLANNFWSDQDFQVSNLELATGFDLRLMSGDYLKLGV